MEKFRGVLFHKERSFVPFEVETNNYDDAIEFIVSKFPKFKHVHCWKLESSIRVIAHRYSFSFRIENMPQLEHRKQ